ncbi:hypothetical protein PtA15_5A926 [Puccinia triticina]|uniref:Uncharacterized protein n=1 Tax=Puccinia triticina TaxID=208348 RepID=A0ABY7CJD5_9BASI|nr:uncharacterized protein PtA15_5A926 [Puccinia triticina]WAQ85351.1 hypothetical protein PtA15_5A926 [Puccinia triticina]WAR58640.1 hypothetical protein PtB15_5B875 [Puccinia triticina]
MQFTALNAGLKWAAVILLSPHLFSVCMSAAVASGVREAENQTTSTKMFPAGMYSPGLPDPTVDR